MTPKILAIGALFLFLSQSLKGSTCGSLYLNNQAQVDAFAASGCDSIIGSLEISGLDITSLDSLITLKFVSSDFIIDSTSIQTLQGLDSLAYVGDFRILNCYSLIDVTNLTNISHCTALTIDSCNALGSIFLNSIDTIISIQISNNENLILLNIANNISQMLEAFYVIENHSLDSIFALNNITFLPSLSIFGNNVLEYVNPFSKLLLLGSAYIINNDSLKSINCFPKVKLFGSPEGYGGSILNISENLSLSSIEFPDLKQVRDIWVFNNPSLQSCCFINQLVAIGGISENFLIYSNDSLCSNLSIILSSCEQNDPDGDNIQGSLDNCPEEYNPLQTDIDLDGIGNACDNCPSVFNPDQSDINFNGIGDVCEGSSSGKIGLHTSNPKAGVQIDNSDLYLGTILRGLIMRNFLGECFRISIDELGQIKTTPIPCPN